MHSFHFEVSLRVFCKSVEPTEIAAQLGLVPKWKHKIGEQRTTPKCAPLDGVYDSSYCSFSLIRRGEEELHELLSRTADKLFPHKDPYSICNKTEQATADLNGGLGMDVHFGQCEIGRLLGTRSTTFHTT